MPDASFAGQQKTRQNVRGPVVLIDSVRNCFASLFTPAGVGLGLNPQVFLQPGDIVKPGIDGLGTAKQKVIPYEKN